MFVKEVRSEFEMKKELLSRRIYWMAWRAAR
jgi:hypothetical protein